MSKRCRDEFERPGCLGEADERYTMDFTDVEPGAYIYWCAHCGPEAMIMDKALTEAFETRPGFARELETAMDEVEAKTVKS